MVIPALVTVMRMAQDVAQMSNYPFTKVGCVITDKDYKVISSGYNRMLTIEPFYMQMERETMREYFTHAEIVALSIMSAKIAHNDFELIPHVAVCTLMPCTHCLNALFSFQISKVIYFDKLERDKLVLDLAHRLGMEMIDARS